MYPRQRLPEFKPDTNWACNMHLKSFESSQWACDVPVRVISSFDDLLEFRERIVNWFAEHVRIRPDYQWYKSVDTSKVYEQVRDGNVRHLLINETYVLVYDVGVPWYGHETMIEELLVVRLYQDGPGTFSDVLKVLESLRTVHGAKGIACGNSLSRYPRALERMYTRKGYQASGTSFYWRA